MEYVATNDYILRPPMLNIHFFLVDASPAAVSVYAGRSEGVQGGTQDELGVGKGGHHHVLMLNAYFFLVDASPAAVSVCGQEVGGQLGRPKGVLFSDALMLSILCYTLRQLSSCERGSGALRPQYFGPLCV